MYALCLDYKTEQAHIDYILRTRRLPAVSVAVPPARRVQRLAPRAGRDGAPRAAGRRAAVRRRRRWRSRCRRCRWREERRGRGVAAAAACACWACSPAWSTALQPTRRAAPGHARAQPRGGAGRRLALDGGAAARRRTVARRARGGAARARGAAAGRLAAGRATRSTSTPSARASRPPRAASLREPPGGRRHPHRRGAGRRCARATPGAIWARWCVISDGIDTGRIGEGPLDARHARRHRGAGRAGPHRRPRREVAARSVGGGGAGRRVRVRAHARQHRGGHPADRACPTGRSR